MERLLGGVAAILGWFLLGIGGYGLVIGLGIVGPLLVVGSGVLLIWAARWLNALRAVRVRRRQARQMRRQARLQRLPY